MPRAAIKKLNKTAFAAMAQQVEHVLGKDEVTGSSPVSSSIKYSQSFESIFLSTNTDSPKQ